MPRSSKYWILFFFCCANVLTSFNISALTAVIPAISRSLNVPVNDVAGIIPFYMVPYGLGALFFAPLAARYSIKALMIVAFVLFSLGNWMCLWSDSLPVILNGRVIAGLGAACVTPLALMTLGKIFDKEVRGRVLGFFFSSAFFGVMLGLLLSAFAEWHWLFTLPACLGPLLALALCFCPREGMEANTAVRVRYLEAFQVSGLRNILVFIFGMSMLFNAVVKSYGVYLDKIYHYSQPLISVLIILTAIAAVGGQLLGGLITDRWGRARSCYIGITIIGLSVMALFFEHSLIVLGFILAMVSIGWTIGHNGVSTVLTDFPDTYRLELAALNSAVRFFSGGLGFYISGNFIQANFGLSFLCIGALMLSQVIFIPRIVPRTAQASGAGKIFIQE